MPDLNLTREDRIRLRCLGVATEEDNILDAAKDWIEGRTTLEAATRRALDDIGTRRSSQAFNMPAANVAAPHATVPAATYDALLHSYQHLDAQMAPLYRALRDAELSRANWRFVACLGIAAGIVYGFVQFLEALR